LPKKYSAHLNVVEGNLSGGSPVIRLTSRPQRSLKLPQFKSATPLFGSFDLGNSEDARVSFAIDTVNGEERVYIDLNHNNDLTDDGVFQWTQELKEDGTPKSAPKLEFKTTYSIIESGETKKVFTVLNLRRHDPTELIKYTTSKYRADVIKKGPGQSVLIQQDTHREGAINIQEEEYRIALVDCGMNGLYDKPHDVIFIDLDQDGEFDLRPESPDRFLIKEPININGITYRMVNVTPSGDFVELQEVSDFHSDRVSLEKGGSVPMFSGKDISGKPISLFGFLGKILLLYFWSPECKPCEIELPYLKKAYAKYQSVGFEIIGISSSRFSESVKTYTDQNEVLWSQIFDTGIPGSAIFETFRVKGIPKTFLIDKNGILVEKELRGDRIGIAVNELL
jgi:thiol-disulfide isomerase/thioredoxin